MLACSYLWRLVYKCTLLDRFSSAYTNMVFVSFGLRNGPVVSLYVFVAPEPILGFKVFRMPNLGIQKRSLLGPQSLPKAHKRPNNEHWTDGLLSSITMSPSAKNTLYHVYLHSFLLHIYIYSQQQYHNTWVMSCVWSHHDHDQDGGAIWCQSRRLEPEPGVILTAFIIRGYWASQLDMGASIL